MIQVGWPGGILCDGKNSNAWCIIRLKAMVADIYPLSNHVERRRLNRELSGGGGDLVVADNEADEYPREIHDNGIIRSPLTNSSRYEYLHQPRRHARILKNEDFYKTLCTETRLSAIRVLLFQICQQYGVSNTHTKQLILEKQEDLYKNFSCGTL